MKIIPTIIATSVLLVSLGAGAQTTKNDTDVLVTGAVATKEAAYQMGVSKLAELKAASPYQLSRVLAAYNAENSTVHLNDGSYVTIQERMNDNGQLSYVGLVNVKFGYVEHDSSH
jgi:hypothetical protein